jgi:hypothetical protein
MRAHTGAVIDRLLRVAIDLRCAAGPDDEVMPAGAHEIMRGVGDPVFVDSVVPYERVGSGFGLDRQCARRSTVRR